MKFPLSVVQVGSTAFIVDREQTTVGQARGADAQAFRWLVRVANQSSVFGIGEIYSLLRDATADDALQKARETILRKISEGDASLRFLQQCPKCSRYAVGEEKQCYICGEEA